MLNRSQSRLKRLFTDTGLPTSPESKLQAASLLETAIEEKEPGEGLSFLSSSSTSLSALGISTPNLPPPQLTLTKENLDAIDAQLGSLSNPVRTTLSTTPSKNVMSYSHPSISGDKNGDEEDTDSTVCAETEVRVGLRTSLVGQSATSEGESNPRSFDHARKIRQSHNIANLVRKFDLSPPPSKGADLIPGSDGPVAAKTPPTARPSLRRGKSDLLHTNPDTNRERPGSRNPDSANRHDTHTSTQMLLKPSRPSYHLKRNRSDSKSTRLQATGEAARPLPTRSNTSTTLKNGKRSAAASDQDHSSDSKRARAFRSQTSSRLPVPRANETSMISSTSRIGSKRTFLPPSAPTNRVSTIARHFDRMSREAERDRQKKLVLARGRRARPLAVAKPVLDVFTNAKDALREDSDDGSGSDDDGSADDEQEEEEFTMKGKPAVSLPGATLLLPDTKSELSTSPVKVSSQQQPASSATVDILSDIGNSIPSTPSMPASPFLGTDLSSSRLSQMSESEMSSSGTERHSLMKTISSLWAYRSADFTPLEYPLQVTVRVLVKQT